MGLINCALNLSRKTGGRNQKFRQPCQASIEVGWMSTLGHKWTLSDISAMSALPPKADITADASAAGGEPVLSSHPAGNARTTAT